MDESADKLKVNLEDGREIELNVIDILESTEFNKEFILYTIGNNDEVVYASILNETEDNFTLDTITDQAEINYVNTEIKKITEL